uniref:B30.2/SPRY domain-containing protein n=1 Tax=Globodera rostochiensis TaxID=31243 RepID=A0A914HN06_GLORO
MNSPTADDAGFDFVTEEEMDTLAIERGKAIEDEKEEDEIDGSEAQSDEMEQNAAALQLADAVAFERPFDAHKVFRQTLSKLKEYQNEQRQNQKEICVQIGELKKLVGPGAGTFCLATELITQAAQANAVAWGEEHWKLLAELEALRAQMTQVKQREAQMLLRMDMSRKVFNSMFPALTPNNRWDVAACYKLFTPVEPKRLIVEGRDSGWREPGEPPRDEYLLGGRSVFAEMPIPKKGRGIFYFELKYVVKEGVGFRSFLYIGLAPRQMPLDVCVGIYKGTYAYDSWGSFWGHDVPGCGYDGETGAPVINKSLEFGNGDVIGCGLNLATRQIIYTKNGERLDTANLFVDSADDLFPCISFFSSADKIESNFGPSFKCSIADGI